MVPGPELFTDYCHTAGILPIEALNYKHVMEDEEVQMASLAVKVWGCLKKVRV